MKDKKLTRTSLILGALIVTGAYAGAREHRDPDMGLYDYQITRVIDGDTVEFQAPFLPAPLKPVLSLRVYGVDTPEKGSRAACKGEADRGAASTEFTRRIISESKHVRIAIMDWDKYGGRVLGDVILDGGVSLRSLLISNGYAHEYYGGTKAGWCN